MASMRTPSGQTLKLPDSIPNCLMHSLILGSQYAELHTPWFACVLNTSSCQAKKLTEEVKFQWLPQAYQWSYQEKVSLPFSCKVAITGAQGRIFGKVNSKVIYLHYTIYRYKASHAWHGAHWSNWRAPPWQQFFMVSRCSSGSMWPLSWPLNWCGWQHL